MTLVFFVSDLRKTLGVPTLSTRQCLFDEIINFMEMFRGGFYGDVFSITVNYDGYRFGGEKGRYPE